MKGYSIKTKGFIGILSGTKAMRVSWKLLLETGTYVDGTQECEKACQDKEQ